MKIPWFKTLESPVSNSIYYLYCCMLFAARYLSINKERDKSLPSPGKE